jgi:hypothetical protein
MSTSDRKDGLEDYTLGKDYGPHRAGDTIPVDPERRDWLNSNGYSRVHVRDKKTTATVHADSMRGQRFADPELSHPPFTDDKEV